ncbi:MAG: hypothetical protein KAS74_02925 [Methanosarcinales archaeon]|nr:hypothetical protein [Methanosarcinales archaeon]
MDATTSEWKDVPLDDVTSELVGEVEGEVMHADVVTAYDANSGILKDYVKKRFGSKGAFAAFINKRAEMELSDKKSYDILFSEIYGDIGEGNFLSILAIEDIEEAEMRCCLADMFYKDIDVATWRDRFAPLYERLTGEKIKIRRRVDKKLPSYRLAFDINRNEFISAWIDLYTEGVVPPVIHYENIVIGPLGWLKSLEKRDKDVFELYSDVIDIIGAKYDPGSQDIIFRCLLGIVEQIGNHPSTFQLQDEVGREALKHLKEFESEKDAEIRSAKALQIIHKYLNDENIVSVINKLIASREVPSPKVHGLYERYPYSFSNWIITKYGIFKQDPLWERKPNERLSELIQKKVKKENLEPELEPYQGDYPINLLAYCVRVDPKEILGHLTGIPNLRNIAKQLGIPAAQTIKNKDELIKLILLRLGFNIPPDLVGISQYRELLADYLSDIDKNKPVKEIMRDVYVETESLLRDLSYFYICWYSKSEEIEKINETLSELNISDKPFQRLTLGEHIKLIRTLNTRVKRDGTSKKRFLSDFGKDYILPPDKMDILDKISASRKPFIHLDKDEPLPDREECIRIVSDLQCFSEFIENEEIFPAVIQTKRDVTDEYGIAHYEVFDDRNNEWWVYKDGVWLDVHKLYFMHATTKQAAIHPVIIEKIF